MLKIKEKRQALYLKQILIRSILNRVYKPSKMTIFIQRTLRFE